MPLNKLRLRKIFLLVFPVAMAAVIFGSDLARPQDIRTADVSHDLVNKINLGLLEIFPVVVSREKRVALVKLEHGIAQCALKKLGQGRPDRAQNHLLRIRASA